MLKLDNLVTAGKDNIVLADNRAAAYCVQTDFRLFALSADVMTVVKLLRLKLNL